MEVHAPDQTPFFEWREAPAMNYAVLGDPVAHSLSPRMHAAAMAACDIDATYMAVRVPAGELEPALDHLHSQGCVGVNCTIPLKAEAREWAQSRGGLVGWELDSFPGASVNTLNLESQQGISTDEPGFMKTIQAFGLKPCPVIVLGAGGSAQAIVPRLIRDGFEVRAWGRTLSKWLDFRAASSLDFEIAQRPEIAGCELIINATSTGLTGERLDLNWSEAPKSALAYDLAYTTGLTPFLAEASGRGLKVMDGRPLLVEQGALSFEWWHGIMAPRNEMREAIFGNS